LPGTPLPERLRPELPTEVLGQKQAEKIWQQILKSQLLPSLVLWGPPGTGKTSFANALIANLGMRSENVNAIEVGAKNLREIGHAARDFRLQYQKQTVVFVDEIHRLNKSQQDVLLPFIEKGEFILIGATTENPSYDLNRALLSRCRLVVFDRLNEADLKKILTKAFESLGCELLNFLTSEAVQSLIRYSDGDARKLLMAIESLYGQLLGDPSLPLDIIHLEQHLGSIALGYDRQSDQHYDTVSAFIKSIRGSDPDAALYYLARMIKSGEDPVFIARRLVVAASEDIGNADPRALSIAISAAQAVELVGLPEAGINLSQAVIYLACAPKSNRSYLAWNAACNLVEETGTLPIPLSLRSAKTAPMKQLGYGEDYKYPHDYSKNYVKQAYMPAELVDSTRAELYQPSDRGFEKQISEYLRWLKSNP
jgi:putative ATPase